MPTLTPDPEHLAALAEFAAGAGHEVNNPLATIIGRAQQLLRAEDDPQRRHSLAVIAAQAYRIRDMIGDVMTFARPPVPRREELDLVALTRSIIEKLSPSVADSQTSIRFESPGSLACSVDPAQWEVVVSELIHNAQQALLPDGGEILVRLSDDSVGICCEVCDHGSGFTPTECEHAFDPFFSGRQAGRGLGFGLCKVWQIVRNHGGDVQITSDSGTTRVRVSLPSIAPLPP